MYFFPTGILVNVGWFNNDYLKLSKQIELINKSYSFARNNIHQVIYQILPGFHSGSKNYQKF